MLTVYIGGGTTGIMFCYQTGGGAYNQDLI